MQQNLQEIEIEEKKKNQVKILYKLLCKLEEVCW